jgi:hypothetical protein
MNLYRQVATVKIIRHMLEGQFKGWKVESKESLRQLLNGLPCLLIRIAEQINNLLTKKLNKVFLVTSQESEHFYNLPSLKRFGRGIS